jgi:uncharacterized cupin superfamily protein
MAGERRIVNVEEMEWREERHGERFAMKRKTLSLKAGGSRLGCSLYEVPPGAGAWPLHYHFANEEAIYVLQGQGTLRGKESKTPLRAGDYVVLPAGPEGTHQVVNDSAAPLTFLCLSTMQHPDVAVYPESGKLGVFAGSAPGQMPDAAFPRIYLPLDRKVAYWEGED